MHVFTSHGISISSAVFAGFRRVPKTQTDTQTTERATSATIARMQCGRCGPELSRYVIECLYWRCAFNLNACAPGRPCAGVDVGRSLLVIPIRVRRWLHDDKAAKTSHKPDILMSLRQMFMSFTHAATHAPAQAALASGSVRSLVKAACGEGCVRAYS